MHLICIIQLLGYFERVAINKQSDSRLLRDEVFIYWWQSAIPMLCTYSVAVYTSVGYRHVLHLDSTMYWVRLNKSLVNSIIHLFRDTGRLHIACTCYGYYRRFRKPLSLSHRAHKTRATGVNDLDRRPFYEKQRIFTICTFSRSFPAHTPCHHQPLGFLFRDLTALIDGIVHEHV